MSNPNRLTTAELVARMRELAQADEYPPMTDLLLAAAARLAVTHVALGSALARLERREREDGGLP